MGRRDFSHYIGKPFGKWIVISTSVDKRNRTSFICRCECGTESNVSKHELDRGHSNGCFKCGCLTAGNTRYKGYNNISGTYIAQVKNRAIKKGLKYNITAKYVWDLFEQQGFKCNLTGQKICFLGKEYSKRHLDIVEQTASIDRIDSNKGYVRGNIQIVHKDANTFKLDKTNRMYIDYCHMVSKEDNKKHQQAWQDIVNQYYI